MLAGLPLASASFAILSILAKKSSLSIPYSQRVGTSKVFQSCDKAFKNRSAAILFSVSGKARPIALARSAKRETAPSLAKHIHLYKSIALKVRAERDKALLSAGSFRVLL